jgi:3-deoxy-D-manno-octulosonic acid kinase
MMAIMTLHPPPLPTAWPYEPRTESPVWQVREGQDLGDAGGGWTLTVPEVMDLHAPVSPLEGAFGRGGVLRCGEVVIRPYRRGGLVRHFAQLSYASPRRFEREWEIHQALWASGFPTVEPLGYGKRRAGLAWEGLCLTRHEEGLPWPLDWAGGLDRVQDLTEAIRALSGWGLWAPDLNATNLLITPGGLRLLDWDRAAFVPDRNLEPLYFRRLARSLKKLRAPAGLVSRFENPRPEIT